jgi:hypothetical protein
VKPSVAATTSNGRSKILGALKWAESGETFV